MEPNVIDRNVVNENVTGGFRDSEQGANYAALPCTRPSHDSNFLSSVDSKCKML